MAKNKVVEKYRRQSNSLSAKCCRFTSRWNPSILKVEKLQVRKCKNIFKKVRGFKHMSLEARKSFWEDQELASPIVYCTASPSERERVCVCVFVGEGDCSFLSQYWHFFETSSALSRHVWQIRRSSAIKWHHSMRRVAPCHRHGTMRVLGWRGHGCKQWQNYKSSKKKLGLSVVKGPKPGTARSGSVLLC